MNNSNYINKCMEGKSVQTVEAVVLVYSLLYFPDFLEELEDYQKKKKKKRCFSKQIFLLLIPGAASQTLLLGLCDISFYFYFCPFL